MVIELSKSHLNIFFVRIMTKIIVVNYFAFLLWQIILLTFTNAQDEVLQGIIKDGDNEIHFKWKKTEQLLANEHLPIWIANLKNKKEHKKNADTVKHELWLNFIDDNIGAFVLYHDTEKLSAIVYFAETKDIYGIIDTRYIISGLPLNECNLGHSVGGQYVKKSKDYNNYYEYHTKPIDLSIRRRDKKSISSYDIPFKSHQNVLNKYPNILGNFKDQGVTNLYPEILLFVPYDIIEAVRIQNRNDYLVIIVTHFIVYFNAIDMLFAKLSTANIKIRLNLAGIILENENKAFSFMKYYDNDYLDVISTMDNIPKYLEKNRNIFPEDSFDFIYLSTKNILWSSIINNYVYGLSSLADTYANRKAEMPYRNFANSIVYHGHTCEYVVAAHEIAHLLYINHDPLLKGFYNQYIQCYGIMQEVGQYCPDCLKWSDESIRDLENYARTNRNRCYLMNFPRSLYPYGNSMTTLSPSDQCHCYGFVHPPTTNLRKYLDMIPETGCYQNLICGDEENTILPLDGTPCAHNKVCWNKICFSDTRKLAQLEKYAEFFPHSN